MPRQNRVTPFSEVVESSARGMFMGNRGVLHDDVGRIVRHHGGSRWITCRLEFKGRRRALMQPRHYTELFFLDEATALAAGHRPCAECRRGDFNRFRDAWAAGTRWGGAVNATTIDMRLHRERMGPGRVPREHDIRLHEVPPGAMVAVDSKAALVTERGLLRWTPEGYERTGLLPVDASDLVQLLTPPSTVSVLRAGYQPVIHLSGV